MKENNYFTHGIHPYHAKFIPAIPIEFLQKYGKDGDVVLDPFCGSGTTLLESGLAGHRSFGVDMSNIAVLISKAKVFPADVKKLDSYFDFICEQFSSNADFDYHEFPNKYIWFTKETADTLDKILTYIRRIDDKDYKIVFEVLFSSIIKTVSNKRDTWNNGYIADNVMPNKPYSGDAFKVFCSKYKLLKKSYKDLSEATSNANYKKADVFLSNILDFNPSTKVDIVITSPPYPFAVDFVRYNRLNYYWFGWDVDSKFEEETGSRGKRNRKNAINEFFDEMDKIYKHIFTLVNKGGYFCMTVGNTEREKNKISFVDWLIELFTKNGWDLVSNEQRTIMAQSMAQKRIPTEQKLVFRKK